MLFVPEYKLHVNEGAHYAVLSFLLLISLSI